MKSSKQRIFCALSFALCIFASSCETMEELAKSLQEKISTAATNNAKIPKSYEEAYKMRTGQCDTVAKKIVSSKSMEKLRVEKPYDYVKSVVDEASAAAKSEFHKTKILHDVVCLLTRYDAAGFWSGNVPDQSWQNVLKSRKAVCEGYANLFKRFCDAAKIRCEKVVGYARGVGTSIATGENPRASNHAWNIVQINGESYLVDSTWDSGYMNGKKSFQKYCTDWLFCKPQHFIYTHFPTFKAKQLLEKPLSESEFSAIANLKPRFFDSADVAPYFAKCHQVENLWTFEYKRVSDCRLSFALYDEKGAPIKNRVFEREKDGAAEVKASLPKAGTFICEVFAWKKGANQGEGVGEFLIESKSKNAAMFPDIFRTSSKDAALVAPETMPLKSGSECEFAVFCSDRKFVYVIMGSDWIPLQSAGDGFFREKIKIPAGTKSVSVGIGNSEKSKTEILAKFSAK